MGDDRFRAAKDIFAGSVGGVAQVSVGQPFDTIKTRLQTMPKPQPGMPPLYTSTVDCLTKTVRNEGFMALYKGTTTPLIGIGACVAIQFAALESMKRMYNEANAKTGLTSLSSSQLYLSGAVAGLANSVVSGPVEHIRIRLQIQTSAPPKTAAAGATSALYFSGPFDAVSKIYSNHGIAGIYKGQLPTLIREFHGYGMYFLAYEYLYQRAIRANASESAASGTKPEKPGMLQVMTFGALAGYALWLSVYPIDVIKSKLQADAFVSSEQRYRGMLQCFRGILAEEGVRGFFKGFVPCILRAAPVNAATFLAFDWTIRQLNK